MNIQTLPDNAVAIVGIACRFPGAKNLDQFWENLREGRESISFFTEDELDSGIPQDVRSRPNYVRAKGKLDDADKFDAAFFDVPPLEASIMDPQQRLLLELSWAALEDAGIVPGSGDNLIGVWVGTNWNRYYARHVRGSDAERRFGKFNAQLANEHDFPASRIAYKLNLTGPAITLSTACSTSLVTLGQAMQSLLNYECNAALAGGASVSVPINAGYLHQEGEMLSRDGHCRPFDADATGTTFNDGAAVVALKRLEDAVADGDEVYAVVRGVGINNDGSDKVSYTAPSVNGQIDVLHAALAQADVDPESVAYIETHGTATRLGDPIEVAALRAVYGPDATAPPCALGAVKSNIGHAIHAAGIAGLIKAALAVRDGVIPPTINFQSPNPELQLEGSRFYVNDEMAEWPGPAPRRAGVSSFGVGGTNAHAIVEQPPSPTADAPPEEAVASPPLLLISAKDAETCMRQATNLAAYARSAPHTLHRSDVAFTLAHARARFDARAALFAPDLPALATFDERSKHIVRGRARSRERLVWAFPGQGAQRTGMGAELAERSPAYARALEAAVSRINRHLDVDIGPLLERGGMAEDTLSETRLAQPALFAVGYALAEHYRALGLTPDALIGHSIGEFAAACVAGVFSLDDAALLVCERGRLMQSQPRGAMLSVVLSPDRLERFCDETVCIAAHNAPEATVLAGPPERLEQVAEELRAEEVRVSLLKTSHAFHSAMMDGALEPFGEVVESVERHAPRIPIISTCTGRRLTDEEALSRDYWVQQLRRPVRFSDAVETLQAEAGEQGLSLLELGPGSTLTTLFSQQCGAEHDATPSLGTFEEDAHVASWLALGALWCAGYPLPLENWWKPEVHRRVRLPSYPFRRDRHWLEPVSAPTPQAAPAAEAAADDAPGQSIEAQVTALFTDLTGFELIASDVDKPLSELGLDSLLLTQVVVALQQAFGVVITIKDLGQDLDTIGRIARHVERRAPADGDGVGDAPGNDAPPGRDGIAIQSTLPRRAPARKKKGRHRRDTRPTRFTTWEELGETRARALRDFIDRHVARTESSKRHTARFRRAHADPRTAAGFHPLWKEMVYPLVVNRSRGSELWDVDGNRYIDLLSGFGPNLLGHAEPDINEAIREQLDAGLEIGPQSHLAGETAELVCELTGMDRASFMCTGSEAVQAALRCARTFTRRSRIVLFEGAYHGNFDEVLTRGANTPGRLRTIPGSPGIPGSSVAEVVVLPWNHEDSLAVIDEIGDTVAAVLVEPVQSRLPETQPAAFLRSLRDITHRHGSVLIFDEVVTGFRCHPGGAQAWFGVDADLATYGKVAGGNMPIGIVAGREDIMNTFDGGDWAYGDDSGPDAGVTFFAGTFVRHPLAIAACRTMLERLKAAGPRLQEDLAERAERFADTLNTLFRRFEAPYELARFTSVMYLRNSDVSTLGSLLWYALREHGVFALEGFPSYLTLAHRDEQLAEVATAVEKSLQWMVDAQLLVAPRALNVDATPDLVVPLEAPAADARLGEDAEGNPGWFREEDGAWIDVVSGRASTSDPWRRDLAGLFPTSESQQEIWSSVQLGDDASCAFNDSVSVALPRDPDLPALRQALDDLARRHEALRATVSPDGTLVKVARAPRIDLQISEDDPEQVVQAHVTTPFDLVEGPLFRFTLATAADGTPTLVVTCHHVVCDGWSIQLLLRELSVLYRARRDGVEAELPAANRLSDYNREASDLADTEAEDYWLDEFDTLPPVLDFPADHARPRMRTFESKLVELRIDRDRVERLRALAASNDASLYNVLLAGWFAFTSRLTGSSDIVVGIPTAGQVASGMPNLVGHCVNLLPLRARIDLHEGFDRLVAGVKEKLTDGLAHQGYTFGRLLKRLPLPRDASRLPLVSVQFNLDPPVDPEEIDFGADTPGITTNPRSFENFELFVNITEDADGLLVLLQYNSNLFDEGSIANRLAEYFALLDDACDGSGTPTAELDLLTGADLERLRRHAVGPDALDHDRHVLNLIDARAEATPDALAVVGTDRSLTYGQLVAESTRRAARLADLVPEGANALIGVALPRDADLLVSLLAVWRTGAAYVPLDPEFPADRLRFMAEDAGLSAVVTTEATDPPVDAAVPRVFVDSLADGEPPEDAEPPRACPVDARAYVIYTSGSTGRPKGVEVGHRALSNFLQSMCDTPGLDADSRLVAVTTLSFDIAGLELFGPLVAGGTTIVASHEQAREGRTLLGLLESSDANLMQATPVTWRMLLDAGWSGSEDFRVLCGGEAFPGDLATDLLERTPRVYNLYGPTEATVWSTVHVLDPERWRAEPEAVVPIGAPIHGTQVFVLDEAGNALPPGVPGELYIGGVGLAQGYLNRKALTRDRFIEHDRCGRLYRTGDVVTLGRDGALRFRERVDTQVKVRGFRIELGEIESALAAMDRVAEAVATVYEPAPGDTRLAAYYVSPDGELDETALRAQLQERLPPYMLPQHFVALEALPLTPNRKVDRKALPEPVPRRTAVVAPRNETELLVADLWSELLRTDNVGVEDDFFNLGGHSILATRMIAQLEERAGLRVPLRTLFAHSVLADFAGHVAAAGLVKRDPEDEATPREVLEF